MSGPDALREVGRQRRLLSAVTLLGLVMLSACSGSDPTSEQTGQPTPTTAAPYRSEIYDSRDHWLCLPDKADDPCHETLETTVIEADGTTTIEVHETASDPPIDCFYVYPTISGDRSMNSDLEAGPEERATIQSQAARLSSQCRIFAPVYRQVTLGVITGRGEIQGDRAQAGNVAYADVVDAWHWYLANENDGRGVVLIGHSQGSGHLTRLIREEIDPSEDARARLVGAYLLGSAVRVPQGQTVGGDFQQVPLCTQVDETGCVVTYASFRSTSPPPPNSFFGRPRSGEGVAGCVNPASPGGGAATLHSYFPASAAKTPGVTTRWVSFPGLVTAECVEDRGFSYLNVTVHGDPSDPRVDDIPGDLTREWGLHLVDVNLAMGDIVAMVGRQATAFAS
jgi:hypothetical protein